jgi:hypothetical protein
MRPIDYGICTTVLTLNYVCIFRTHCICFSCEMLRFVTWQFEACQCLQRDRNNWTTWFSNSARPKRFVSSQKRPDRFWSAPNFLFNPLNPELNPICYLLALLGAHHFLHVSRIRIKLLTFRLLMSYIYGAPILDVSRSHTTTQQSR